MPRSLALYTKVHYRERRDAEILFANCSTFTFQYQLKCTQVSGNTLTEEIPNRLFCPS